MSKEDSTQCCSWFNSRCCKVALLVSFTLSLTMFVALSYNDLRLLSIFYFGLPKLHILTVDRSKPSFNANLTLTSNANKLYNFSVEYIQGDIWVGNEANIKERIQSFNNFLTSFRERELLDTLNSNSVKVPSVIRASKSLTYSLTDSKGYFKKLKTFNLGSQLTTVFLTQAQNGSSSTLGNIARQNLLITKLYRWTGVMPACLFHPFQRNNMILDRAYCQPPKPDFSNDRRINMTQIYANEDTDIDNAAYGKYDATVSDDATAPKFAFFMHIVRNAITDRGAVYARDIHIEPQACHATPHAMSAEQAMYDEVFVAAIPWWNAFYHTVIESLTKMAVSLAFLRANPSIRIHLATNSDYVKEAFQILGLDPQRIITGAVRAKVVYSPRPTCCFEAPILDLQAMAGEYRDFAKRTSTDTLRNSVVYIRRTKFRQFANNSATESLTKELSYKYGLRFELLSDDALPSLTDTVYMFYRARVIVAPHGAGLVHIQYARPCTIVIETVYLGRWCPCFLLLSHVLGHRHHVVAARGGIEDKLFVDLNDFRQSIDFHLKYAAEHSDDFV